MKKTLILVAAILGFAVVASAQPRAIGVRAGSALGYGAEFSYQHSFGSNFGELDLGVFSHGFDIVGIYDFVLGGNGTVNVYLGPGAMLGFINEGPEHNRTTRMNAGLAGQFGVEFNIPQVPLQLSIDWRPVYLFVYDAHFTAESFGLGIRYRF